MRKTLNMWCQFDYLRRHYQTVIGHLTRAKVANIILNDYEMRRKKLVLRSLPPFLKVEATALCQLECPGCPWHAESATRPAPSTSMTYEQFVEIMEPIKDTTVEISFSLRGDTLLNKEAVRMVGYCRDNNIGSVIPSNLSYEFGDDIIEAIIDSGLDHLIVAVDGTTQEVYEKYRKGGRLELVLDNSRRLIEMKRQKRSKTPLMECKFIRFTHNDHQYDEAKQLSESMGFDRSSSVLDVHHPRRPTMWNELADRSRRGRKACYWVYRTSVILSDGQVCACCDDKLNLGNALADGGFRAVWNGDCYRTLRRMFVTGKPTDANCGVCVGCSHFWAGKGVEDVSSGLGA
jgi:MoaA/NifB/PqqE/SkfB family radical SAM enzyme